MRIQKDVKLSEILWYKIGGIANFLLECENREDILEAIEFIKTHKPHKILVCGTGSNLIFPDGHFDGVVIQIITPTTRDYHDIHITPEGYVDAFAGEMLDSLILFAFDHQLTGLEWAGGLPGTIGAGVRGNVGAYGGEMKDTLVEATVLDYTEEKPELKTLTNQELQFVYRGSYIKSHKKMVVVSARFLLKKSTEEEVAAARAIYNDHREHRKKNHPLDYANCGSVFKNLREKEQIDSVLRAFPDLREYVEKKWYGKVATASVIEHLGLKGYQVGDAQISEKHALFIINKGNATAHDVLSVINKVKDTFNEKFGFEPEVEVEIVQ